MGVKGGVGDGAAEVGVFAGFVGEAVLVEVLLGEAEVDHVDVVLVVVKADHEVAGLDVAVDVADGVQLLDGFEHLEQHVDGALAAPALLHALFVVREILAHELHDDAVRLLGVGVRHEVVDLAHVLQVCAGVSGQPTLNIQKHRVLEL